jgi:hypothetical protein
LKLGLGNKAWIFSIFRIENQDLVGPQAVRDAEFLQRRFASANYFVSFSSIIGQGDGLRH